MSILDFIRTWNRVPILVALLVLAPLRLSPNGEVKENVACAGGQCVEEPGSVCLGDDGTTQWDYYYKRTSD